MSGNGSNPPGNPGPTPARRLQFPRVMSGSFHRILVPVDFSEGSRSALDEAIVIAERFGASIDLFHAWQLPTYAGSDAMFGGNGAGVLIAEDTQRIAGEQLDAWTAALKRRGFPDAKGILAVGDPATSIVEHADAGGYDLIVIGTHGRTGLRRLALGSVAEQVVRHAQIPVLTVRGSGSALSEHHPGETTK